VKKVLICIIAGFVLNIAYAQSEGEEDYTVVLPDDAQACVLPAAPDAIPAEASYEQMVEAKQHVADFQSKLETYRGCLHAAEENSELTAGNKQALVASHNYSVEMEERVAERFNEAVRSYKERTAKQ
jgi:hypothetical protein